MQTRLQMAAICLTILGGVTPLLGQAIGPSIPQRGIVPTGSYSLSDIEAIDQVYGNVTINIPITGLPAARANFSAPISLVYNSAIYARNGDSTLVNSHFIDPTDSGGWRYSFNYELTDDYAPSDTCDNLGNPGPAGRRFRLITPDGASHVLYSNSSVLARSASAAWTGYYFEDFPNGTPCPPAPTSPRPGTFDFYTADGSYIRIHVTIGSGSTWSSNMPWAAYLPDGQVVTGQSLGGLRGSLAETEMDTISIHRPPPPVIPNTIWLTIWAESSTSNPRWEATGPSLTQ